MLLRLINQLLGLGNVDSVEVRELSAAALVNTRALYLNSAAKKGVFRSSHQPTSLSHLLLFLFHSKEPIDPYFILHARCKSPLQNLLFYQVWLANQGMGSRISRKVLVIQIWNLTRTTSTSFFRPVQFLL